MANNIRELRKKRGWSLRELAARMGAHFTTIAKLENSQRKLTEEWRSRFAQALEVKPYEITDPESYIPVDRDWALPVIPLSSANNWRDARSIAEEWIGHPDSYNGTDWQFVIHVDLETEQSDFPIGAYVYVDPDDRDLADTHYYAIRLGSADVRFAMYRNDPPRFTINGRDSEPPFLMLGHEPFVTVGKIVGAYRRFSLVAKGVLQKKFGS